MGVNPHTPTPCFAQPYGFATHPIQSQSKKTNKRKQIEPVKQKVKR
jgi:hypothetical protein